MKALFLAFLCAACAASEHRPTQVSAEQLTVPGAERSGCPAQTAALHSAAAWEDFWRRCELRPRVPAGLEAKPLFAICLGERPSAGYSVEIRVTRQSESKVSVAFREVVPSGAVADVITSPCRLFWAPSSLLPWASYSVTFVNDPLGHF
jgi:hypothetical protein